MLVLGFGLLKDYCSLRELLLWFGITKLFCWWNFFLLLYSCRLLHNEWCLLLLLQTLRWTEWWELRSNSLPLYSWSTFSWLFVIRFEAKESEGRKTFTRVKGGEEKVRGMMILINEFVVRVSHYESTALRAKLKGMRKSRRREKERGSGDGREGCIHLYSFSLFGKESHRRVYLQESLGMFCLRTSIFRTDITITSLVTPTTSLPDASSSSRSSFLPSFRMLFWRWIITTPSMK